MYNLHATCSSLNYSSQNSFVVVIVVRRCIRLCLSFVDMNFALKLFVYCCNMNDINVKNTERNNFYFRCISNLFILLFTTRNHSTRRILSREGATIGIWVTKLDTEHACQQGLPNWLCGADV